MKKIITIGLSIICLIGLYATDNMKPTLTPLSNNFAKAKSTHRISQNAPTIEFTKNPAPIISTYYDYMPGGYNSWCLRKQPATSQPTGYPANGSYIVFHTQETSSSTRRVYYAYIDDAGNVVTTDPISSTDVREGYPGIDIDPVTGNPFVAWHAVTEDDGSYDSSMAYDLYHLMGSAGLWTSPWEVIDNPEVGWEANGHDGDEYIWPKVMIGPSPVADKRRVYIHANNSTNNSADVANYNMIMGYADFSTTDLDMQSTLDWTYKTFPLMDEYHYDNVKRTIKDMTVSDDGKVAIIGWAGDSLKVWYSEDYGETFELHSQECHYNIPNPQNQDGTHLFEDESTGQAEDIFIYPSPDGGNFNAVFTENNSKIVFMSAMGLTSESAYQEAGYYPFWFFPKVFSYDIIDSEFSFWDMNITGNNPGDDQPMIPWDLDEDGNVDSFSEDGYVQFERSWPTFFYGGPDLNMLQIGAYACGTFRLSSKDNWLVAVWQDGVNALFAHEEESGYENWFETPEIAISISSDYGETWSEPAFLNANPEDVNYYEELANMIPCYIYPSEEIEVIDETHGEIGLFFLDDNSYGNYIEEQYGLNNGGTLRYAKLKIEFPENVSTQPGISSPAISLTQNYPNPFNPETTIEYSLQENSKIELSVYNIKGQKVRTLENKRQTAGKHQVVWNGKDNANKAVASGVYFYKLQTNSGAIIKRMMLLK